MKRGFTLIELIVVISVIAILAGIVTPLVGSIMEEARKTRMVAETNTLKSAILGYNHANGFYPYTGLTGGRVGYAYAYPPNGAAAYNQLLTRIERNLSRRITTDPFGSTYYYYYYNEASNYGIGVVGSMGPNKTIQTWDTNTWLTGTIAGDDYFDAFYKR